MTESISYKKITKKFHRKEKDVVSSCEKLLAVLESRGDLIYQRNNTGAVRVEDKRRKSGYRNIRFGRKGSSDFYIFLKGGRTVFAEMKSTTGKQEKVYQVEFEQTVKRFGFLYVIVRSVDDLLAVLRMYLKI